MRHWLPTNVVTDCAARELENRPADTEMAVPAARLELEEVTYDLDRRGERLQLRFQHLDEGVHLWRAEVA